MTSGGNSRQAGHFGAAAIGVGGGYGVGGGRGFGRGGGGPAMRVCEFYLTPAGCNRGNNCNFAHPTGRAAQQALAAKEAAAAGRGGRVSALGAQTAPMCDYFFSRRGCSKGNACPFSHTAPGPVSYGGGYGQQQGGAGADASRRAVRVCAFYATEKGCVKGRQCDFLHVEDKVCDFYLSKRGCKKGQHCNFKHVKDEQPAAEQAY